MLTVAGAAAAAGAAVAWWRLQPRAARPQAVESLWARRFDLPAGGELSMQAFQGKPLLLNFWATWCPPCVEELPMIDGFWREHAANGFQVLALAIDQPSSVRRFLERQSLGFPVAMGGIEGMDLVRALGNPQGGLPFSVFFDANGNISRQKTGQLTAEDLKSWAERPV